MWEWKSYREVIVEERFLYYWRIRREYLSVDATASFPKGLRKIRKGVEGLQAPHRVALQESRGLYQYSWWTNEGCVYWKWLSSWIFVSPYAPLERNESCMIWVSFCLCVCLIMKLLGWGFDMFKARQRGSCARSRLTLLRLGSSAAGLPQCQSTTTTLSEIEPCRLRLRLRFNWFVTQSPKCRNPAVHRLWTVSGLLCDQKEQSKMCPWAGSYLMSLLQGLESPLSVLKVAGELFQFGSLILWIVLLIWTYVDHLSEVFHLENRGRCKPN